MNITPVKLTPEVIQAIDEELAYTASLPEEGRADHKDHGIEGQIVTLSTYTRQAQDAWTKNSGEEPALHELRKCAAIALRALILYGCPRRGV